MIGMLFFCIFFKIVFLKSTPGLIAMQSIPVKYFWSKGPVK